MDQRRMQLEFERDERVGFVRLPNIFVGFRQSSLPVVRRLDFFGYAFGSLFLRDVIPYRLHLVESDEELRPEVLQLSGGQEPLRSRKHLLMGELLGLGLA